MRKLYSFFENIIILFLVCSFTFLVEYLIHIVSPLPLSQALLSYGYLFIFGIIGILSAYFTASENLSLFTKIGIINIITIIFFIIFCVITGTIQFELLALSYVELFFINKLSTVLILHDDFIELCGERTGTELRNFLFENKFKAMDLGVQINKTKKIMYFLSVYLILIIISEFIEKNLNIFLITNSIIFIINYILFLYILSFYKKEVFYTNIGISQVIPERKRFYRTLITIFLVSILIGTSLARNTALIKIDTSSWFKSRPARTAIAPEPPEIPDYEVSDYTPPEVSYEPKVKKDSLWTKILEKLWFIIQIIVLASPIIILLVFIILKIYYGYQDLFIRRIFRTISDLFKRLKTKLKNSLRAMFKKEDTADYEKLSKKDFMDAVSKAAKIAGKSREKRIELDRITKQFIKIIAYGSKYKILYTKNLAPEEYTNLLKEYFIKNAENPGNMEKADACSVIGRIYEKALYDKDVITKEEETQLSKAVLMVISKK